MIKIDVKPLSVNQCYTGRRFSTEKHKSFKRMVNNALPDNIEIFDKTNMKLRIEFGYSSKLSDLSNGIKVFEDALVQKYKVDDRNTFEMNIKKVIVKKGFEYIKFEFYE